MDGWSAPFAPWSLGADCVSDTRLGRYGGKTMDDRIVRPGSAEVGLYVVSWFAMTSFAVAVGVSAAHGRGVALSAAITVAVVVVGIAMAWVAWRCVQTRLIVRSDELVVRNPFRTVAIPRSSVVRIAASPSRKWIVVDTASGETIPIWAISSGLIWTIKKRAARWNDELQGSGDGDST